jgi:N-acetylglucosamine-6-sulfatase
MAWRGTSSTSFLLILILSIIHTALAEDAAQQPLFVGLSKTRPNILFILTDDQDLHMDSLSYMPFVKEHLIDRGTSFQRHYCTVALCCPSRVSMWTGKAARKLLLCRDVLLNSQL